MYKEKGYSDIEIENLMKSHDKFYLLWREKLRASEPLAQRIYSSLLSVTRRTIACDSSLFLASTLRKDAGWVFRCHDGLSAI